MEVRWRWGDDVALILPAEDVGRDVAEALLLLLLCWRTVIRFVSVLMPVEGDMPPPLLFVVMALWSFRLEGCRPRGLLGAEAMR